VIGAVTAGRRRSATRGTPPPCPRPPPSLTLRAVDGETLPLDPQRWHGPITTGEHLLLAGLRGPVLDVGCGPGRLVGGLVHRGTMVLGVDSAPGAVSLARGRGWPVLQRSVFAPLPGEGRWRSVLLLDGNVGIGGDTVRLLRRCQALLHPRGTIVVEVEPPGSGCRTFQVRLEQGGQRSAWFAWSVVGADAIAGVAAPAGLQVAAVDQSCEHRWFAHLTNEATVTHEGP
jgi:SAM-dependent methyltransferase